MNEADRDDFDRLIVDVHAFYRQPASEFVLDVWWEAARPYDLQAVRQALSRHARNPDGGQFLPKPADMVRMLEGRTVDSASQAWSKVDRAVRSVGPWRSVVFDDPLIHAVVDAMGGWIRLCDGDNKEWPFKAKEFQTRYQGLRMRSERPPYPPVLIGTSGAHNLSLGGGEAPVMLGDRDRAMAVFEGVHRISA